MADKAALTEHLVEKHLMDRDYCDIAPYEGLKAEHEIMHEQGDWHRERNEDGR